MELMTEGAIELGNGHAQGMFCPVRSNRRRDHLRSSTVPWGTDGAQVGETHIISRCQLTATASAAARSQASYPALTKTTNRPTTPRVRCAKRGRLDAEITPVLPY